MTAEATIIEIPVLRTERLVLRAPQIADFDTFAAFIGSARARFVGGPVRDDKTVWRAFAHMAGLWTLRGFGPLVWCLRDGTPIGSGGPWMPRGWPEPELGWMLWFGAHERQGYATEAMRALLRWTLARPDMPTVVAYIHAENAASIRVAQRLGATHDAGAPTPHRDAGEPAPLVYRFMKDAA